MSNIKCVLFDLDGTVLNTNNLIIKSFQHTLRQHLNLDVKPQDLYPYFGEPLRTTLERFGADLVEDLIATYREFNITNHDTYTTIFPGAKEVLQRLRRNGIQTGIVTSKIRFAAQRGLQLFKLENYFDVVVAAEDTAQHKPHPAPILTALARLNINNQGVIMVGDSPFDLRCARNAGVYSAAVGWSVHPRTLLAQEQPDYILESFNDLLTICAINQQKCAGNNA